MLVTHHTCSIAARGVLRTAYGPPPNARADAYCCVCVRACVRCLFACTCTCCPVHLPCAPHALHVQGAICDICEAFICHSRRCIVEHSCPCPLEGAVCFECKRGLQDQGVGLRFFCHLLACRNARMRMLAIMRVIVCTQIYACVVV